MAAAAAPAAAADTPGLAQLAAELARHNARVLIWDRSNCGESDVCFEGDKEGMAAVADLPDWAEQIAKNPGTGSGSSARTASSSSPPWTGG